MPSLYGMQTSSAHSRSEVFIFKSFLPAGCIQLRVPSTPAQSPTPPHHLDRHGVIEISRPLPLQAPSLLLTSFPSWRLWRGGKQLPSSRKIPPTSPDRRIHLRAPLVSIVCFSSAHLVTFIGQTGTNHHVKHPRYAGNGFLRKAITPVGPSKKGPSLLLWTDGPHFSTVRPRTPLRGSQGSRTPFIPFQLPPTTFPSDLDSENNTWSALLIRHHLTEDS